MSNAAKRRKKRSRQPVAEQVRTWAASGLVEDQIAARLRIDKNELRRRYIDDIKRGKAIAAASAAEGDLTREEKCACDSILSSFDSEWNTPEHGNLLWRGLLGDSGARNPVEAFAAWALAGSKFICTGYNDNFSVERLQQFAAVKAAALKLLAQNGTGNR
jgi:hypothetical protein